MPKNLLIFIIFTSLLLGACGIIDSNDAATENEYGLKQSEDGGWSEVTEPTSEDVYSDFEPYIREEGSKGTQENPYNISEKAIAKVGYWDPDMNQYEAMIEIEIDTLITGDEAEDPDSETPDWTQQVLAVTNVKMIEGPDNTPYSISLQPLVFNDRMYIAQEAGINNSFTFENPISLGKSQTGTISMLAPEGDLNGQSFLLNTGVDQVWFNF